MISNLIYCRMFLVVYSDRGLVLKGKPNLKLFNTLYWIFLFTFSTWGSVTALESFSSIYNLTVLTIIQCLTAAMIELVEKLKKNYVNEQCLNQTTFSSFGGKHRYIFTGQETRMQVYFIQFAMVIEEMLPTEPFDPFPRKTTKSILTFLWAFYFGLFIPIRQLFCSRQDIPEMFGKRFENQTSELYARQPEKLSPRGPTHKSQFTNHQSQARNSTAPKCKDTIIQVDPVDRVQEKHKNVPNTSQYLAPSFNNHTVHAEVHSLPTVTE
jgi:hypothetical protein